MIYDTRDLAPVRNSALLVSAVTWGLLLVKPGNMLMLAHCPPATSEGMPLPASLQMLRAMNPPLNLVSGWALMLVAMMSPVLIQPIRHVRMSSFTHRRARSIALFVTGYAAVWMAVGVVLLAIALMLESSAPQPYLLAAGVALVTLVWQLSPMKQRCLNRCHSCDELAAFGSAADFDALHFGTTHGIWCAGSCWGWMLFPMLLPRGHMVAMAIVAVLIFSERLEPPGPLGWRWRGFGRALNITIWQMRIRWMAIRGRFLGGRQFPALRAS